MPSYMYAVKEHHLDKQKKYTDKVLSSKNKREREKQHPRKNKKSTAPSTRNLQARVALFAPLERGNILALIETFRLGGGRKDDDEKNEIKILHFCFVLCAKKKKI